MKKNQTSEATRRGGNRAAKGSAAGWTGIRADASWAGLWRSGQPLCADGMSGEEQTAMVIAARLLSVAGELRVLRFATRMSHDYARALQRIEAELLELSGGAEMYAALRSGEKARTTAVAARTESADATETVEERLLKSEASSVAAAEETKP